MIQIAPVLGAIPYSSIIATFQRIFEMGEIRINLTNTISVGLMAFVFVWLANKGLAYAGKPQWKA